MKRKERSRPNMWGWLMEPGLLRILRRRQFPFCKPPLAHKHMVSHIDKQTLVGNNNPPCPHNPHDPSPFITTMLAAEHTPCCLVLQSQLSFVVLAALQLKEAFSRFSLRLEFKIIRLCRLKPRRRLRGGGALMSQ